MRINDEIRQRRDELGQRALERYRQRSGPRKQMSERVDREGIFAAAGIGAATRRAAHMSISEGRNLVAAMATVGKDKEALIGPDDSDNVSFLVRGQLAARAVCRLTQAGQPVGTGFLVAPGVIVTNNHVIGSAEEAATFIAEFDYELDVRDQPRVPVVRFALEPERLFATSDADRECDFTFVAVSPSSRETRQSIRDFGWIPLDPSIDKILVGEPAIIVQHPRGEMKRLCLFASEIVDKLDKYLQYTTDTDHGSSGSCVFNRSWQLVALHHASAPTGDTRKGLPKIVNEGIRVSVIVRALGEAATTGNRDAVLQAISDPAVIGDGRPQSPADGRAPPKDRPGTNGSTRATAPTVERTILESTAIQSHPPTYFQGRADEHFGYKPTFLGRGATVPLPRLPEALAGDVAEDDGAGELKYTHYSVVFSTSRKLPVVTAVNIDGKSSRKLARTDRKFEAGDKWFFDPRVAEKLQLHAEIYDRTDFDFGHMVRREDPVWGDLNIARMANDDTFYMTNCAPQHHDLNTRTWLALENAVLDSARNGKRKVSVFTGPVLSPQDPTILDVQVPTAFWKIVAYVDGGRLRSHGFMQFQTRLVADMQVRESLTGLEKAAEYQVAVAEIARVTALDFGALVAADELGKAPRRRLNESLIGSLFATPDADDASAGSSVPVVPVAAAGSGPYPVVRVGGSDDPLLDRGDAATFFAGMHEIARGLSKLAPLVERIADQRD